LEKRKRRAKFALCYHLAIWYLPNYCILYDLQESKSILLEENIYIASLIRNGQISKIVHLIVSELAYTLQVTKMEGGGIV